MAKTGRLQRYPWMIYDDIMIIFIWKKKCELNFLFQSRR